MAKEDFKRLGYKDDNLDNTDNSKEQSNSTKT